VNLPVQATSQQSRIIWWAITSLAVAAIIAVAVLLLWGVGKLLALLSPVLWPLAVAGAVAYLLDPVVDYLVARGVRRPRAIIMVFGLAFVVVTGVFASIVPQLYEETKELVERIPEYRKRVERKVDEWMTRPPRLLKVMLSITGGGGSPSTNSAVKTNLVVTNVIVEPATISTNRPSVPLFDEFWQTLDHDTLRSASGWLAGVAPRLGGWLLGKVSKVGSVLGIVVGLTLVPVYAFYFLLEKHGIERRWTDYLPVRNSQFKKELVFVLRSINDYLIVFFRSQVLVAICDGVLYTIGFLIIGLPYALLLGVIAVFLTMIPFLGAITTCVAALIIALVQFGDWTHMLLVLAVFAVVQSLEGFVIQPKIVGDRVGLHPLAIIVAVMAGTTLLGGILGGILAIPFAAALRVLMFRYVWKKSPL
jgi:predicted PurR-regulated permease PerM